MFTAEAYERGDLALAEMQTAIKPKLEAIRHLHETRVQLKRMPLACHDLYHEFTTANLMYHDRSGEFLSFEKWLARQPADLHNQLERYHQLFQRRNQLQIPLFNTGAMDDMIKVSNLGYISIEVMRSGPEHRRTADPNRMLPPGATLRGYGGILLRSPTCGGQVVLCHDKRFGRVRGLVSTVDGEPNVRLALGGDPFYH